MPSISTFNANNFFLRYKFSNTYPGSRIKTTLNEANEIFTSGFMPGLAFGKYTKRYIVWDAERRELAARALQEPDGILPDILCFQEIENIYAIRKFNQKYLDNYYPYSLLIDAYDPRNIDVGILSRFPMIEVKSHIEERDAKGNTPFYIRLLGGQI